VRSGAAGRTEADATAWLWRRLHEFADGIKYGAKLCVVVALQFVETLGKIAVGGNYFSELDEGAHDDDVDLNGAWAAQDA
jgi:hypothetical protein